MSRLSRKDWNKYVERLSAINKTAGLKMRAWIDKHGTEDVAALVRVAYALVTKYGEAASAAACQMHDEIAEMQNANVPPAEPKATQNIRYVDAAIRSTLLRAPGTIPSTVSELVKRTGAETTLKNAQRDGAYFAWVPNGDTCAFCITLASNGWRRASKKTANGDHADHIHKNCDCEFAISFNGPGQIEGYDPDKYLAMYEGAEGYSWKDKVNSMRRAQYAANKDAINAQKRAAYAARSERARFLGKGKSIQIDNAYIGSQDFRMSFRGITRQPKVDDAICEYSRNILRDRTGTYKETLVLLDADTGKHILSISRDGPDHGIIYDEAVEAAIKRVKDGGHRIIAIHNHPNSLPPTMDDGVSALVRGYDVGVAVGHDGSVFTYTPAKKILTKEQCEEIHNAISYQIKTGAHIEDVWYSMLEAYGMIVRRR